MKQTLTVSMTDAHTNLHLSKALYPEAVLSKGLRLYRSAVSCQQACELSEHEGLALQQGLPFVFCPLSQDKHSFIHLR